MGDKLHLRSARWGPPWIAAALAWCLLFQQLTACGHPAGAQEPETSLALATDRDPAPAGQPSPASQLPPPAAAEGGEELLPINLPAALRLANAQAWDIAIAVRQVRIASAQLQGARVLWLPNLIGGVDYLHHDGPVVSAASGAVTNSSYSSLYAGMAPLAIVGLTDALFAPLAARQVTCAQQANVQTATNDTLTSLAVAYFDVVEARACLACIDDVVRRVEQLVCKTESLAPELVPELEVARARAALASVEEVREAARRGWRVASAEVVRLARLKPAVLIAPLESPQLQLTLVPAECTREGLIATALQNRPELAFQRAQVEAARHRLQQERWRPFLPTLVARGSGTQAPYPMALGAYGGGPGSSLSNFNVRSDFDLEAIWELRNAGLGNRALISERQADFDRACLEAARLRDSVTEEVTQVWADLQSADHRIADGERELAQALISAQRNLENLGQTDRVAGEIRILVIRPVEVVVALQVLNKAYFHYFGAVADHNRAQFRLYRALGSRAQALAADEELLNPSPASLPHEPGAAEELPPPAARPGRP